MSGRVGYVPAINIPPGDFLQNPGGLNNNAPLVWSTGAGNIGDGGAIIETKAHSSATYVQAAAPISGVTRDGSNRLTGATEGPLVYSSITRDGAGRITGFTVGGVAHTITRDGSNRITGVS